MFQRIAARYALRLSGVLASLLVTVAVTAPVASARDGYVTSFDGTKIVYSFFPAPGLAPGRRAPTVMMGPGYSSGRASSTSGEVDALGQVSVPALLAQGYNVLTWDPRGFGDSGGNVETDGPQYEARDVSALIDYIAQQPEAQLQAPGDPLLGMTGASYGGGIQLVSAATDPRIDVITPIMAWNSLVSSLYTNQTVKGGWGSVLYAAGASMSPTAGIVGGLQGQPAGFQAGRSQDPHVTDAFTQGLSTGMFPPDDVAYFASRGPDYLLGQIHIPTLIVSGTVDTLFPLREAIANYEALRRNGAPLGMLWFCGGHGACNTQADPPHLVQNAVLNWLAHYLKGDTGVATGPRFQWLSDAGVLRGAGDYPTAQGPALRGGGAGTLPLVAGDTSGALIAAAPAANAVNVALAKPAPGTELLGQPTLPFTYTASGATNDPRLYAQLIDDQTHTALGNQVTPIPITLDGQPHAVSLPLEAVAVDAGAGSSYTLQITDGTSDFFADRSAGVASLSGISVSVPTVGSGGSAAISAPTAPLASAAGARSAGGAPRPTACAALTRVRFVVHRTRSGAIVRVRVFVNGHLVQTRRGRSLSSVTVALSGTRGQRVRIDAYDRRGLARRSIRTVNRCDKTRPVTHSRHARARRSTRRA